MGERREMASAVGIYGFILLFGISRGAATLARATLIAARYGPARFGAVNGALSLTVTFAHALAPFALGAAHDTAASYDPALWLMLGLSIIATGLVLLADPDEMDTGRVRRRGRAIAPPRRPRV
ncbi:MAG: hypothetical protein ACR2NO_10180 [Chloroflexota bacterium]